MINIKGVCKLIGDHMFDKARLEDNEDKDEVKMDKPTNPKDALGIAKVPMHCVSARVLMELGLAMMEGGRKYGTHNYRKMGVRGSVYYDATMRHIMDWWEGQDIDPDSGVSHIIKAIAGLVVMRDSMLMDNFEDDRPIRLPDGLNIADLNEQAKEIIKKYPVCKMPFIHAGPKKMSTPNLDKLAGEQMDSTERAKHRAGRRVSCCPNSLKIWEECQCNSCVGIRKVEQQRQKLKAQAGRNTDTSRGGHDWVGIEDVYLRYAVKTNLSVFEIAKLHQRTEIAIVSRMEKLSINYRQEIKHEEGKIIYDDRFTGYHYNANELCQCFTCRTGWDTDKVR